MRKLLKIEEAAEILGVSVGSMQGMVKRNSVPYIRLTPRVIRFDEEELQKFLEKRTVKPWR